MAIKRIWETVASGDGSDELDFDKDRIDAERTRIYRAESDMFDTEQDIINDPLCPKIEATYRSRNKTIDGIVLKKVAPKSVSKGIWDISCTYETPPGSEYHGNRIQKNNQNNQSDEPQLVDDRFFVTQGFEVVDVPFLEDLKKKLVVNSAGDRFDPPLTTKRYLLTLQVRRKEKSSPYSRCRKYRGKINDDSVIGVLPGYLFCRNIGSTTEDAEIWDVTYDFIVLDRTPQHIAANLDASYRIVLDAGWNEKVADKQASNSQQKGPKTKQITDSQNHPIAVMANLDGKGKVLAEGEKPFYLSFAEIEKISFSSLNLPSIRLNS